MLLNTMTLSTCRLPLLTALVCGLQLKVGEVGQETTMVIQEQDTKR